MQIDCCTNEVICGCGVTFPLTEEVERNVVYFGEEVLLICPTCHVVDKNPVVDLIDQEFDNRIQIEENHLKGRR